jgi:hypothetical protein
MFFFSCLLKPFIKAIQIPLNRFYEIQYPLFPIIFNLKSIPILLNHQAFSLYIHKHFEDFFQNDSKVELAIKDLFHHIRNRLVDCQL